MIHNLYQNVEVRRLKVDGTNFTKAAGTSDTLTSEAVDTLGYAGVAFMIAFGAVVDGGACAIKVQHSDDNVTYADVAGSAQTIADTDDNKVRVSEYWKPTKRYFKFITTRATQNLTVDGLFVHLYYANQAAVTQGATVAAVKQYNSAASGTA